MNEALLQFIWQYSLYRPIDLKTVSGDTVTILFPGKLNKDSGPDFSEARIKVADTILIGNIELHVNASDWLKHGHQHDAAYKNIVLHVVYNNDAHVIDNVPVLDLSAHIPAYVMAQYTGLLKTQNTLPCAGRLADVRDITKESWLSRLLAERWQQKLGDWEELLQASANDWRNLLYWRMAANFGFKINATPFLMVARSLPLNILARHHDNLMQIEALLFGQAGMLEEDFKDDYPQQLKKEYQYLRSKYQLTPVAAHLWKFMRLRPANFPTVRIAQFAALIHKSVHLFAQVIETHTIKEILPLLDVTASWYWDNHFTFDEPQTITAPKHLGTASIYNIIINTVAPIQFLYAHRHGLQDRQEKALQLLEAVPAEQNNILKMWQNNGWKAATAAHSQPLIQLYNNYCSNKRCLECAIGLNIIRSAPAKS